MSILTGSFKEQKELSVKIRNEYENNPKFCLRCNIKISFENRKGKFCSKSCSASYNNKTRTCIRYTLSEEGLENIREARKKSIEKGLIPFKEWNKSRKGKPKEVSSLKQNNFKKKREKKISTCFCKSCDKETTKTKSLFCVDCRKYSSNKKLFLKLGINTTNLQEANSKAVEILYQKYFIEKKSSLMIRDEYKIMLNTLYNFFKKNDLQLRTLSEGIITSMEENRLKHFTFCSKKYKNGYHITWEGKKVWYKSSYELCLMKKLDLIKEKYDVEKIKIKYINTENKEKIYITDFYLPEKNLILETKGEYFYKLDKENIELKKEAVLKKGYYYMILFKKDIEVFNLDRICLTRNDLLNIPV